MEKQDLDENLYFNGKEFGYMVKEDPTDVRWAQIIFITTERGRFLEWCRDDENIILG